MFGVVYTKKQIKSQNAKNEQQVNNKIGRRKNSMECMRVHKDSG